MTDKISNTAPIQNQSPEDTRISAASHILTAFLTGFTPADSYGPWVVLMTTDEIISAMGDMVDLTQNEVAQCLTNLGFKCGYNQFGNFGWLLRRVF